MRAWGRKPKLQTEYDALHDLVPFVQFKKHEKVERRDL